MAYLYTRNLTPAFGAEAIFNLKTALKAAGWTVTKSSDGVTFNASGDQITVSGTGAGGMRVVKAWFVIQQPTAAFGFQRQFCFQNADANGYQWRIKYSAGAGFSGGSPGAIATPSATDEGYIFGAGTDAAPTFASLFQASYGNTVPVRQQIMVNNASPYEWYTISYPQGGGDTNQILMLDVMSTGSFDVLDVDPYVILAASLTLFSNTTLFAAETVAKTWFKKGLAGALFMPISASQYQFGTGVNTAAFAHNIGANAYSNKDNVLPLMFGRTPSGVTAVGLKGQSTLLRWVCNSRSSGDTLTLVSTSDAICATTAPYCVALPWDGSTPLV
jgi:hypothetical protein